MLIQVSNLVAVGQRINIPTATPTLSHARSPGGDHRLAMARLDRKVSPDAEPLQECLPECVET